MRFKMQFYKLSCLYPNALCRHSLIGVVKFQYANQRLATHFRHFKNMKYHLAQINISRIKGVDMNDPIMADFVALLEQINALAEQNAGFVWRLKGDGNNATDILPYDDTRIIINMSVWENIESLQNYVFGSAHTGVMKRRKEWFNRFELPATALWYVPAGHAPTIEEAKRRLAHLQEHGATTYAFGFKK